MTKRVNLTFVAKAFLSITGLYWFLVLTSIVGITDFLNGKIMQGGAAIVTGIMLLLPVIAFVLLAQVHSDDDRAQLG